MNTAPASPNLKHLLDSLYASRSPVSLGNDPLSFCHRFEDPADREVVAVIASSFAYGAVTIILRTLEAIFKELGDSPRRFAETFDPAKGLRRFEKFKHRFNDGRDLCALIWGIRLMLEASGSVNKFFLKFHNSESVDLTDTLNGFTENVLGMNYEPVFKTTGIPQDSSFRFFFPAPASGSACKRLCMFMRWVVRPEDGVDLGIWHGISPSQLLIPVDTHVSRIAGYLGFTSRKNADWRMAREITSYLRRFDPADPVKYDFALAHLGISGGCNGLNPEPCRKCPVGSMCSRRVA